MDINFCTDAHETLDDRFSMDCYSNDANGR